MTTPFRRLPRLPPYGPLATAFPPKWGRFGREGLVVAFEWEEGEWVANFQPGLGGVNVVCEHPNGHDVVVIASGDLWVANPELRSAELVLCIIGDQPVGLAWSPLDHEWRPFQVDVRTGRSSGGTFSD